MAEIDYTDKITIRYFKVDGESVEIKKPLNSVEIIPSDAYAYQFIGLKDSSELDGSITYIGNIGSEVTIATKKEMEEQGYDFSKHYRKHEDGRDISDITSQEKLVLLPNGNIVELRAKDRVIPSQNKEFDVALELDALRNHIHPSPKESPPEITETRQAEWERLQALKSNETPSMGVDPRAIALRGNGQSVNL